MNLSGADACIILNGSLLVGKRKSSEKFFGGHWELPGGKTEDEETLYETIEREIMEELGVRINAIDIIYNYEYDHNGKHYIWKVVKSELIDDVSKIQLHEHDEIRWIKNIEELGGEKISDLMKDVINVCLTKFCQ